MSYDEVKPIFYFVVTFMVIGIMGTIGVTFYGLYKLITNLL